MSEFSGRAQLFLVHIWLEPLGEGQAEWRGRIQFVNGERACYFRDWKTMTEHMQTMLTRGEGTACPFPAGDSSYL